MTHDEAVLCSMQFITQEDVCYHTPLLEWYSREIIPAKAARASTDPTVKTFIAAAALGVTNRVYQQNVDRSPELDTQQHSHDSTAERSDEMKGYDQSREYIGVRKVLVSLFLRGCAAFPISREPLNDPSLVARLPSAQRRVWPLSRSDNPKIY